MNKEMSSEAMTSMRTRVIAELEKALKEHRQGQHVNDGSMVTTERLVTQAFILLKADKDVKGLIGRCSYCAREVIE